MSLTMSHTMLHTMCNIILLRVLAGPQAVSLEDRTDLLSRSLKPTICLIRKRAKKRTSLRDPDSGPEAAAAAACLPSLPVIMFQCLSKPFK
jgi:hypothetical protein